jgi:hypothetical protein
VHFEYSCNRLLQYMLPRHRPSLCSFWLHPQVIPSSFQHCSWRSDPPYLLLMQSYTGNITTVDGFEGFVRSLTQAPEGTRPDVPVPGGPVRGKGSRVDLVLVRGSRLHKQGACFSCWSCLDCRAYYGRFRGRESSEPVPEGPICREGSRAMDLMMRGGGHER